MSLKLNLRYLLFNLSHISPVYTYDLQIAKNGTEIGCMGADQLLSEH